MSSTRSEKTGMAESIGGLLQSTVTDGLVPKDLSEKQEADSFSMRTGNPACMAVLSSISVMQLRGNENSNPTKREGKAGTTSMSSESDAFS